MNHENIIFESYFNLIYTFLFQSQDYLNNLKRSPSSEEIDLTMKRVKIEPHVLSPTIPATLVKKNVIKKEVIS